MVLDLNLIRNTSPYVAWCWDMGNTFGLPVVITANGSVAHSTSRQKFGDSSIEIGGGSDHLTAPDDPKLCAPIQIVSIFALTDMAN